MTSPLIERRLAYQQDQAAALEERLLGLLSPLARNTRALDVGCGTGALACALGPHVAEVVGLDADPTSIEAARSSAPGNCSFQVGDAAALPFPYGSFSLTGCLRVLHHVARPELVISELVRVTRPGGVVLVVDQLGSFDPIHNLAIDAFEQARDPSHHRLLTDTDIRALLDANDLVVRRNEITCETRRLDPYLNLVGLEGPNRDYVRALAPGEEYEIEVGWYVAEKAPSN